MPKNRGKKKITNLDFTINDSANAPKPVGRVKKSTVPVTAPVKSWEDLVDNDYDVVDEINSDGSKNIYFKKGDCSKNEINTNLDQGVTYPEIVWYLISPYVKPEEIGNFACINKATYAITKRESFWRGLYIKYCKNHPRLPDALRIENSFVAYGLRQRVIRALYHTYNFFFQRTLDQTVTLDCSPHRLIKRRCVNVWYYKARFNWIIYFKLKRQYAQQRLSVDKINFIQELGRIDANPDEGCQVLKVTCLSLNEVPPLMGMALSSVNVSLAPGLLTHKRLHLGFNSGIYNDARHIVPECSIVIDSVVNMAIYDWWHPKYPHSHNKLPSIMRDEELLPVLREDFFTPSKKDKLSL